MHPKRLIAALAAGACLCAALLGQSAEARAGEIAAIVEEISDPAAGVAPMDLLEQGDVLELNDGATLVLGYLLSCTRETISGGRVVVGEAESTVSGGTRDAEDVDCDGAPVAPSSGSSNEVAGAVFRNKLEPGGALPKPERTLFGVSPALRLTAPADRIRIQRLDEPQDAPIEVVVQGNEVDLAERGVRLVPGGLYAVVAGAAQRIVKVSPLAEADAPLLSRFVAM